MMMMRFELIRLRVLAGIISAAIAVVCLNGCAAGPSSNLPAQQATMASLSLCNRVENGCSVAATFSLNTIRDLSVDVQWKHLASGTHTQTTELLEPGGGSYQVQNVSFVIDDTSDGSMKTNVVFPVAGSWITQRAITGNWNL